MSLALDPRELVPPKGVLELTRDLEKAGFEVWAVGGAVRDAFLGHAHLDWDLATSATPDQVRTVFGRKRTIPVGIEFGTVKVFDGQGVLHEVTTFRRDVRTDGRHAEVEFGASLEEDLARRDFTVNAIAFSPSRRELVDPFGGRKDLGARVIRAVGDPAARMREDRLRALRALRFASRFDFEIDPPTWEAIRDSAPHLTRLSAERVKQELEKTMDQVKSPSIAIARWRDAGALAVLVPELSAISGEALRALDCAAMPGLASRPGRRLTRLAVLFSEIKPDDVFGVAARLRFSNHDAHWIASLVGRWQSLDSPIVGRLAAGPPDATNVRRWTAAIGRTNLSSFFRMASARWSARRDLRGSDDKVPAARAVHSLYRNSLTAALREPLDLRDLAIDGEDLRQVGIAPGPQLGTILSVLLDQVLDDPRLNTRDRLMEEARRVHADEQGVRAHRRKR
ncbi:MAG: CCA tRNA nucleotidyltransferase [Gemmatimonadaceae bacterium]